MTKKVGTWWIRDGIDERKTEAEGFGDVLQNLSSFDWTENHGDSSVLRRDFVETAAYTEKVDEVDIMYMSSHGDYDRYVPATYGRGFQTWDQPVQFGDTIDWGKEDLEVFSSHACRLLYHSETNRIGRWIPAFRKLHYMFGFHTVSHSGKNQKDRGRKFATHAAWHLFWPVGWANSYTLREAWKKACMETESNEVTWAYLRADGEAPDGTWVNTYNERLETTEPDDPVHNRRFYRSRGAC